MMMLHYATCLLLLPLFLTINTGVSQSYIGINIGQVADNLPPPSATAKLLQSTTIQKVRLYGADPAIIKSLANTGIGIVIGAANGDIPSLASDPNAAASWINTNVLPFYPASNIVLITVGNEVFSSGDQNLMNNLLPAVQNVQNALNSASLGSKIKVSTVHSMAVMTQSEPPSAGLFDPGSAVLMKGLLEFNKATGSPFAINPYPYFAYRDDPRPDTLAFCLFQPNSGRVDGNTKIRYMNMWDAQLDAIHSALNAAGFKEVDILVAETGWPYRGDGNEAGPSVDNAKAYNANLIAHLRSMAGTPLVPGKSVDTYIFAMYDEDLKPGPGSERGFGLFNPDLTPTYDVGLMRTGNNNYTTSNNSSSVSQLSPKATAQSGGPTAAPPPTVAKTKGEWCVPKKGVKEAQLQANVDSACGQNGVDCSPIQPGGPCFEPNTVSSHAAYAMNLLFQNLGRSCDFSQTAILSTKNPMLFFLVLLQATILATIPAGVENLM
ncbi:Glucan endo-1,3-beta-glucosidase 7 [Linum grandiflorum]